MIWFTRPVFLLLVGGVLVLPLQGGGLTRPEAGAAVTESLEGLRRKAPREGLAKELPVSLAEQLANAAENGGKLQLRARQLPLGDKEMPYVVIRKEGKEAADGRALFLCLHGGGQNGKADGPHAWPVNTREFQVQVSLAIQAYQPDGIYFVPRMADDRMGRWWHRHNQEAFDAVIDHAVVHWGVSPDRVYLLGVSEGGYGTDILAVWTADRFAGAYAMAAGVGLGTPPANLRNLPFRTGVGENDMMFERKPMAVAFHAELDRLHELDPGGYVHFLDVQRGRGHGIDYPPGVTWVAQHRREPWPERVVWINQTLDGRRRDRFYWLSLVEPPEQGDFRIAATADRRENRITMEVHALAGKNADGNRTHGRDNVAESERTPIKGAKVALFLSDHLLDLDRPVTVLCNGEEVHNGVVERSREVIEKAMGMRPDPAACPTARLVVTVPGEG